MHQAMHRVIVLLAFFSLRSLAEFIEPHDSEKLGITFFFRDDITFSHKCVTHTFTKRTPREEGFDDLVETHDSKCNNLTLFVAEKGVKWKFEIKLKKRISLMLNRNEWCHYYILMEKPSFQVGPGPDNEAKGPTSRNVVRSAAFRACKKKRRQTPVFEGTWFSSHYVRFDLQQIDGKYVVGRTLFRAFYPKNLDYQQYDYYDQHTGERAAAPDVRSGGGCEEEHRTTLWPIPGYQNYWKDRVLVDTNSWKQHTSKEEYVKEPPVVDHSKPYQRPLAEIVIGLDKLLMKQKDQVIDKKQAVLLAVGAVNVAESYYQLVGVNCKLIAVRWVPDYPFKPEHDDSWDPTTKGFCGYDRMDAFLNYLKNFYYWKLIKQPPNRALPKSEEINGIPDVTATFTNIYNDDEEAGHSLKQLGDMAIFGTVEVNLSMQLGFTYVKPINKRQINNLTGDPIHVAVTGASLAHQMTHLFGWGHPHWGGECQCVRNEGYCVLGSCKKDAYILPFWRNRCRDKFPVFTRKSHPQLFQKNMDPVDVWHLKEEDGYTIEEMLMATVVIALIDIFLGMAFAFHMSFMASQARLAAHPHVAG